MVDRDPVRFGVLGVAAINDSAVPGILRAHNAVLHGIASRRDGVAAAEAERWGAAHAHGSYEELLDDPDIEAVYLPFPNHAHAEWTLRLIAAGKHVLCEKPLALNHEDVLAIRDAAGASNVFVLEALMYRFASRWQRMLALIAEGAIGEPRVARIGIGFKQYYDDYNIRFDPDAGGGAIWDLASYSVDMSRAIFGADPTDVTGTAWSRPGEDVDTSAEAILRFPEGCSSLMHLSFDYPSPYSQVEIIGTDGWMSLPGTGWRHEPFTRILLHRGIVEVFVDGVEPEVESFPHEDLYKLEVEHLSDCIRSGQPLRYGLDGTLVNTHTIEAMFDSIASERNVRIAT